MFLEDLWVDSLKPASQFDLIPKLESLEMFSSHTATEFQRHLTNTQIQAKNKDKLIKCLLKIQSSFS